MKTIKFCHVLIARDIPANIKDTLGEQPARSGMYNWTFVFQGDMKTYWSLTDEDIAEYDIIQVNMSPKDMPIIAELRRRIDNMNANTKLVINNDYVCEYWGKWGIDPLYYEQVQRMGDMVFGTEPNQVSQMIKGAYCLTHPTNTKVIKHLGSDYDENSVGFLFHWWAGHTYIGALTLQKVKEKYGVETRMYGYNDAFDEMKRWKGVMFDDIAPLMAFPDFAEKIQGEKCLYDPNPFHTYGRNGVELACLRKPIIGSNRVFSYQKLFPDLTIDPFNRHQTMEKFDMVLKGSEKVEQILDKAYEDVEYFNYENSKKRFIAAFEESIDRGGHKWNLKN